MTRSKLKEKLDRFKIPDSDYSLSGSCTFDCLGIEKNGEIWEVYDSKKGNKKKIGMFFCEFEANDYLFYLLMKRRYDIKKRWW